MRKAKFLLLLFVLLTATHLFVSGCSSVSSDVQAGRNALQTGRANDAVGYLTQAAAVDPNYKIPYRVQVSVLAYLGRAYLETGKDTQARQTLERAVKLDNNDPLAHLYLGIAMLKTGEIERGRKEIEVGLRAIDDTLEYIQADLVSGFYWDPNMQIRNDVRQTLAAKLDDSQLIMAGERIGAEFDERSTRRDATRGGDMVVAVAGVDDGYFARTKCHFVVESVKSIDDDAASLIM
jgi:tetratricopeptide (TPR) repeat protein